MEHEDRAYEAYSHMRREPFCSRQFEEQDLYLLPTEELLKKRPTRGRRVCIVGSGAAGLTAALELMRAGFVVTVLEAAKRWGGRIHTVGFDHGVIAELGAMRIPENHAGTLAYVRELGLTTQRFVQKNERALFRMRGTVARACDVKAGAQMYPGDALYGNGRAPLNLGAFVEFTLTQPPMRRTRNPDEVFKELGRQLAEPLLNKDLLAAYGITDFTGADYVRRCQQLALWQYVSGAADPRPSAQTAPGAGTGSRFALDREQWEYLGRLSSHLWLERVSLLQWFLDGTEVMNGPMLRIEGGMSKLVDGFISKLQAGGATLRLQSTARAITVDEQSGRQPVRVAWCDKTGAGQHDDFDFAVVAIPAPAAARIDYQPALDHVQYEALTNLSYIDMAKSAVYCDQRRWEAPPFEFAGGASFTDLPIQQVWYPADHARQMAPPAGWYTAVNTRPAMDAGSQQADDPFWEPANRDEASRPGALLTYMWGRNAKRFGAMTVAERRDVVETGLESLHPGIRDDIVDVQHATWNSSDCGGGAFALFAPGEQERYTHLLGLPHPGTPGTARVFFAGEHLAVMHGWIQSAIQTGIAAVLNIFTSPRI